MNRQLLEYYSDDYILTDHWFGAKANMNFIQNELRKKIYFWNEIQSLCVANPNSAIVRSVSISEVTEAKREFGQISNESDEIAARSYFYFIYWLLQKLHLVNIFSN